MDLILCQCCDRHVRRDEGECPFCGTKRRERLSKATLGAAVALGLGLAVAGCGDDTTPPITDLGTDAAMLPDSGGDSGPAMDSGPVDSGPDDAGIIALYGPPPTDAGQDSGGILPAYGLPPSDAG